MRTLSSFSRVRDPSSFVFLFSSLAFSFPLSTFFLSHRHLVFFLSIARNTEREENEP